MSQDNYTDTRSDTNSSCSDDLNSIRLQMADLQDSFSAIGECIMNLETLDS
eukprot:NODE_10876_length_322_cov_9.549451_g9963_i0.p3 GENE.NODE_10876_length_322_cov_9.549451_g9963_i0~~NODE_10876_length_322_cov_9.549451_g9963_i0.p3  ORF type:complete len:51 (-),score=16.10 NODE_10876_length_322_cov_9.549451_g9963_i0:104-256(-)